MKFYFEETEYRSILDDLMQQQSLAEMNPQDLDEEERAEHEHWKALVGKTQVQLSRLAKKRAAEDWFKQFASVEEALARPELPASIAERQRAKLGQAVSTGARPTPCHQRSSSSGGGSSGSGGGGSMQ